MNKDELYILKNINLKLVIKFLELEIQKSINSQLLIDNSNKAWEELNQIKGMNLILLKLKSIKKIAEQYLSIINKQNERPDNTELNTD